MRQKWQPILSAHLFRSHPIVIELPPMVGADGIRGWRRAHDQAFGLRIQSCQRQMAPCWPSTYGARNQATAAVLPNGSSWKDVPSTSSGLAEIFNPNERATPERVRPMHTPLMRMRRWRYRCVTASIMVWG